MTRSELEQGAEGSSCRLRGVEAAGGWPKTETCAYHLRPYHIQGSM